MDVWRAGLRGVNTRWDRTADELRLLRDEWGVNVIRGLGNKTPLRWKQPPYGFNEENWALLHGLCDAAREAGMYVVIDIHTTPGTERHTTTGPNDLLWKDPQFHDLLVSTWERIVREFKGRPEVIGYDLMNEPGIPADAEPGSPADWNALVARLIKVIRAEDPDTPIIVEPPVVRAPGKLVHDRVTGLFYLPDPMPDSRIVYSPHFYFPGQFTHQGLRGRPDGLKYPGCEAPFFHPEGGWEKVAWDRSVLERVVQPAVKFQQEHDAIIFWGEFSAPRWAPGADQWVADVISVFEEYGWSWAYHSFREAGVWNPEFGPHRDNTELLPDTPRLRTLKAAFAGNKGNCLPPEGD